jgi:hypothetical protein
MRNCSSTRGLAPAKRILGPEAAEVSHQRARVIMA